MISAPFSSRNDCCSFQLNGFHNFTFSPFLPHYHILLSSNYAFLPSPSKTTRLNFPIINSVRDWNIHCPYSSPLLYFHSCPLWSGTFISHFIYLLLILFPLLSFPTLHLLFCRFIPRRGTHIETSPTLQHPRWKYATKISLLLQWRIEQSTTPSSYSSSKWGTNESYSLCK